MVKQRLSSDGMRLLLVQAPADCFMQPNTGSIAPKLWVLQPEIRFSWAAALCRDVSIEELGLQGPGQPLLLSRVGSLADTAALLGMHMPPGFSVEWLLQCLGPQHPVPTIDVPTQESGPTLTMQQVRQHQQDGERVFVFVACCRLCL